MTSPESSVNRSKTENIISDSERLISPEGFRRSIDEEIEKGAHMPYPGYPPYDRRIKMTSAQIEAWKKGGMKRAELPIEIVRDHPNFLDGKKKGLAQEVGENGPFIPNVEKMLLAGRVGGNGFYWKGGENPTADPVLLAEDNGFLKVCLVERSDLDEQEPMKWALPGGMKDKSETSVSALLREFEEETGTSLFDDSGKLDVSKFDLNMITDEEGNTEFVMYGDPRATIDAYPKGVAALITPKSSQVARSLLKMRLKAKVPKPGEVLQPETRSLQWKVVSEENVSKAFASHPTLIKFAIEQWQKAHPGRVVGKDGRIGKAPDLKR